MFDCRLSYIAAKMFWLGVFYAVSFYLVSSESLKVRLIGGIFFTLFLQQSGFMMHDAMHNQYFKTSKYNEWFGLFAGTFCFGISSKWWRDEHNEHHCFTNTVEKGVNRSDPQNHEEIWTPHEIFNEFFRSSVWKNILPYQYLYALPMLVGIGRIAICANAYKRESRPHELFVIALHWSILVGALYSQFNGSMLGWLAFCLWCSSWEGILHMQLIFSHMSTQYHEKKVTKFIGFAQWQVEATYDIDDHWCFDWFHGGLNLHSVHHLWPRMPRHNYRRAKRLLELACKRHGVAMKNISSINLVRLNIQHLKKTGLEFVDWDIRH